MRRGASSGEIFSQVGSRIALLRKQRGLTQETVAEAADLSAAYVARIESGAREATVRTLLAIADALDVSIARLFEDETPEVPAQLRMATAGLDPRDVALLAAVAARFRADTQHRSARATVRRKKPR